MADRTILAGRLDKPAWTPDQWKQFERRRAEQAEAWDREWKTLGTISGKRTMGSPK